VPRGIIASPIRSSCVCAGVLQARHRRRPLRRDAAYDLDNVTVLTMPKILMTQQQLKELYGVEVRAYAARYGMTAPPEEKPRCWRLRYSDEVAFHLDTLPCLPEDELRIAQLLRLGVSPHLARRAVGITDTRHPSYSTTTTDLYSSNPRGFARWFEQRARPSAESRIRSMVEAAPGSRADHIPPFQWKTPLQRTIQLLKRHRDVMFADHQDIAPMSMVITNLAAQSYQGEQDLWGTLTSIVAGMTRYVRATLPRVPNPADPVEDYADKWRRNPNLETNFWNWHKQLAIDVERLQQALLSGDIEHESWRVFAVQLTREDCRKFTTVRSSRASAPLVAPLVRISDPPRPWGFDSRRPW
jgi:hypothetical protein